MPSGVCQFSNAAGLKRERCWLVVSKSPREPELEGALHVQAPWAQPGSSLRVGPHLFCVPLPSPEPSTTWVSYRGAE